MTFTDTFDPRCCSICSGGWYLMCPSSTNMQRCLSRFLLDFLLYWLEENLMNKQQYIVYTNNLPKCLKFSSSTHLKDCERVHIALILTQLFQLLTNHYERCWKYYCLPNGWANFGVTSEEELHLSRKLFWGIFESLAHKVREESPAVPPRLLFRTITEGCNICHWLLSCHPN